LRFDFYARSVSALLIVATGVGCFDPEGSRTAWEGTRQPSRPTAVFPAHEQLDKLPSLPPPLEAFATDSAPVDAWAIAATTSAGPATDEDSSPWGGVARAVVAAHKDSTRLSPALRCAASEVAKFFAERQAMPTESLRRFMVARCGTVSPDTMPVVVGLRAPARVSDAAIFDRLQGSLRDRIEKRLQGPGHHVLGLATVREGGQFAAAAVIGSDEVDLDPGPWVADKSRRVVVRGTLRAPAAAVLGLINRGDYATDECIADPRIGLPHFAFSCRLDEADKLAWMQILVRRNGRVLEDTLADVLVVESDTAGLEYRPHASGSPLPVADAAMLTPVLVDAINRTRAKANLAPLALCAKQSAEHARLVGTLIDASIKGRDSEADAIALGLLAGWNVDGLIREGSLMSALVAPTRDASVWLDFALERPAGRVTLLDPEARRIAIGPAFPASGGPALGAVVTTYALFEGASDAPKQAQMVERVSAARKELGLRALAALDAGREIREQARLVLQGKRQPYEALETVMQALVERRTEYVEGFTVETNDLTHVRIPDAVLRAPAGSLAIEVTHHRVEGAAWGQYVVLFVLARPDPSQPGATF